MMPATAPLKILVLGHSGTEGFGLATRFEAWPDLLEERLRNGGVEVRVESVPLFPVGERAIDYAMKRVGQSQPEVVILSLNAYPCAVPVVSARIRRRFGDRAHGVFVRLEQLFQRTTRTGSLRRQANFAVRRATHRVLGAEPLATVAEVSSVYAGIMTRLARNEGIQVVALREVPFSHKVRRQFPGAVRAARGLQAGLLPVVAAHHFVVVEPEGLFELDANDTFWMDDGVHLSRRGNEAYAISLAGPVTAAIQPLTEQDTSVGG